VAESIQSDERLAEQAASGSRRALAGIFKRYQEELYRYCAALLGNSEDAADALQNTMVKVLGALPGERRQLNLRPWLYRIAHNESVELLRRRQHFDSIDAEALVAPGGPEASAEIRERLGQLIADLRQLPERQRGALLMRELSGLSFEQIGTAFDTSAAVARQTVYEARIGLREMEKGREMGCHEIRHKLSDGDRRVFRRRDVRAHLRDCTACREFETTISERRADFAAIAPLPALAAAGLLKGVLGGAAGGSAGGSAAAAGAGAAISSSVAVKAIATVAVVGVVGVGAADRTGLVPVFSGSETDAPAKTETRQAGAVPATAAPAAGGKAENGGAGPSPSSKNGGAVASDGGREAGDQRASDARNAPGAAPDRGRSAAAPAGKGMGQGKAKAKGAGSVNAHGANPNAKGANQKGVKPNQGKGNAHHGQPKQDQPVKEPQAPVKAKSHAPPGQAKEPQGQAKAHEPPSQSEAGEPPARDKPES
jgi:RNA polymerase sigma factor (sigma-70 family)